MTIIFFHMVGIPRTDALRIREKLEDLISSSATIYSDVRDRREVVVRGEELGCCILRASPPHVTGIIFHLGLRWS